jgi:hypothetical protein
MSAPDARRKWQSAKWLLMAAHWFGQAVAADRRGTYVERRDALLVGVGGGELAAVEQHLDGLDLAEARELHQILLDGQLWGRGDVLQLDVTILVLGPRGGGAGRRGRHSRIEKTAKQRSLGIRRKQGVRRSRDHFLQPAGAERERGVGGDIPAAAAFVAQACLSAEFGYFFGQFTDRFIL